ncbi:MAG: hypothetical protein RL088_4224 [Verrucomicrobiota bacterium]|jgi:serine/threonine protein kinase/WD40 repeat protein
MMNACSKCGNELLATGLCPSCSLRLSLSPDDALPDDGRAMGNYELFEEIGRGGMGVVYRARQAGLNRDVALKMLIAGEFASEEFRRRFRREAEVAARLRHPGIVAIYEIGEEDGQLFYTMELVSGRNLGELTRGIPLGARDAASLVSRVADAVAHAHSKGVLHRDLKPANILLDSFGQPRVADFGLARAEHSPADTRSAHILGSPPYLSPELASGAAATVASDVYAIGAVLYQLLTGRAPFHGENVAQILAQVRDGQIIRPRQLNPAIPRDLETICLKCLSLEPGHRYPDVASIEADLTRFLADEPILAKPPGAAGRMLRWCRRKPAVAALLSLVAALIIALVYGSLAFGRHKAALEHRTSLLAESRNIRESGVSGAQSRALSALGEAWRIRAGADIITEAVASLSLPEGRLLRNAQMEPVERNVSADGKVRITYADGALSLHDGDRETCRFEGFPKRPAAALGDTGKRIAIVRGKELTIHDVPSKKVLYSLAVASRLKCVDWSGHLVAAGGSDDRLIYIWNADTGERLHRLSGHDGEVEGIAFRKDGQELASIAQDGAVRIWHAALGVELLRIETEFNRKGPLTWNADGTELYAPRLNGGATDVFGIRWPRAVRFLAPGADEPRSENLLCSISFSNDGHMISSMDERTCRVWSLRHGRVLSAFPKTGDEWMTARFSGEASLWMSGWNRALRHAAVTPDVNGWNRFSPQPQGTFNSGPLLVAGSRDGKWLALTADAPQLGNDRVEIVSVPSMKTMRLAQPSPYSAALSTDGRWLATGSYSENGVKIWALPSGELHRTIPYPGLALSLSFSGDSTGLWVGGGQGLQRFSTADWTLTPGRPAGVGLDSVAISPTEDYVASITRNEVLLHRCADLTEVARLPVPGWAGRIGSGTLAFSNDGRQLALHAALGAVIVWDIPALRKELAALGMSW